MSEARSRKPEGWNNQSEPLPTAKCSLYKNHPAAPLSQANSEYIQRAWQNQDRLLQNPRQRMTSHDHIASSATAPSCGWSYYARFYGWRFS